MENFIKQVCRFLDIDVPKISYDTSKFLTGSMKAVYNMKDKVLYVDNGHGLNFDFYFAIAHELRHIWQIKNEPLKYFANYKEANKVTLREYNLQLAELDANAFGVIVMADFANTQPQFNGLDDDIKVKIFERAREIAEEIKRKGR